MRCCSRIGRCPQITCNDSRTTGASACWAACSDAFEPRTACRDGLPSLERSWSGERSVGDDAKSPAAWFCLVNCSSCARIRNCSARRLRQDASAAELPLGPFSCHPRSRPTRNFVDLIGARVMQPPHPVGPEQSAVLGVSRRAAHALNRTAALQSAAVLAQSSTHTSTHRPMRFAAGWALAMVGW